MAERVGFEPTEGCPSTVFKTAAFDHSATSPGLGRLSYLAAVRAASGSAFETWVTGRRPRLSAALTVSAYVAPRARRPAICT